MVKHFKPLLTCLLLGAVSACNLPPTQLEPSPQPSASVTPLPEPTQSSPQPEPTISPSTPKPSMQPSQEPRISESKDPNFQNQIIYTDNIGGPLLTKAVYQNKQAILSWFSTHSMNQPDKVGAVLQEGRVTAWLDSRVFPYNNLFLPIFDTAGNGYFFWEPLSPMGMPEGITHLREMRNFQPADAQIQPNLRAFAELLIQGSFTEAGNGQLFFVTVKSRMLPEQARSIYQKYPIADYTIEYPPQELLTLAGIPDNLHMTMNEQGQGFLLYGRRSDKTEPRTYETTLHLFPSHQQLHFREQTKPTLSIEQGHGSVRFPIAQLANSWHIYWAQDYQLNPEQAPQSLQLEAPEESNVLDFQISTAGEGIYLIKTPHSLLARAIQNFRASGDYQLIHQLESPEMQFSTPGLSVDAQGNGLIHWVSRQPTSSPFVQTESKVWMRPVKGFKSW